MLDNFRLKNLRLIVFDLDGTLLNDKGEITNNTKILISKLREKGVRFSFASGRLHSALVKYANELNLATPLISLDGSLIKSIDNKQVIFESPIPKRYVKKAVKLCEQTLSNYALCHGDAIYYTDNNSIIPELLEKYGAIYREVHSLDEYLDNTLEIVVAGDQKSNIKFIEDKMTFPNSFGLTSSYYKSHIYGGLYYLEIRKNSSSKGDGLKKLCKHLGITWQNSAVVGDWYNDRSLFDTKALKIAVANAVPEIIKKADHVTKNDNNNEGVAEFLEQVLLAK
jgi:Cof subfamily protein (haloacid dehalogenase superfamily)